MSLKLNGIEDMNDYYRFTAEVKVEEGIRILEELAQEKIKTFERTIEAENEFDIMEYNPVIKETAKGIRERIKKYRYLEYEFLETLKDEIDELKMYFEKIKE